MFALTLAASLLLSFPSSAPASHVPGRAIVKLRNVDAHVLFSSKNAGVLKGVQARSGVSLTFIRPMVLGWGLFEVRPSPSTKSVTEAETLALIAKLARDADVEDVVPDRWYRRLATPSDSYYAQQWDLPSMGMPAAWDITTGDAAQRVGVVDTGTIRSHEDLQGKDAFGYDFIDDPQVSADGNGRDSDYTDEGDGADCGFGYEPDSWHGTHVAGTILASTNNGAGIAGINWNARLVTARAMGRCGGSLSDIMEAAAWLAGISVDGAPAIGANRVKVMNLSLGGSGACSSYEQQIISEINQQGAIFVAATGNDGGPVGSPANCSGVVAVAAHGRGSSRPLTAYSSFGSSVTIVAPGGEQSQSESNGILSSVGPGSEYAYYEGTSMAAPHVTGVISLVQALDPSLSRSEIVALMQQTGAACDGCGSKVALKADALLAAVNGGGGTSSSGGTTDPVDPIDPTGDANEPNDSFSTGSTLGCGATVQGSLDGQDLDWFRIAPAANARVSLSLQGPAGADFDLYLTTGGTQDSIVARSETGSAQEQLEYQAGGGTLGILVVPYNGASGSYTLTAVCQGSTPQPAQDDANEPNDDVNHGTRIGCGQAISGVSVAGNQDWYILENSDGTVVNATLESTLSSLNLLATNGTGGGGVMAQSLGDEKTVTMTLAGGRIAFTVIPSSTGTSDYVLHTTCTPPSTGGGGTTDPGTGPTLPTQDDAEEPNNTVESAARLRCGSSNSFVALDVDVYRIRVSEGDDLAISVDASFPGLVVTLLDEDGSTLDEETTGADGEAGVRERSVSSGAYFVKLDPGAAGGTYSIDVACEPAEEDTPPFAFGGCSQAGSSTWSLAFVALVTLRLARRRR